jgi:hypothetical protein
MTKRDRKSSITHNYNWFEDIYNLQKIQIDKICIVVFSQSNTYIFIMEDSVICLDDHLDWFSIDFDLI